MLVTGIFCRWVSLAFVGMSHVWHPWRYAGDHYPHMTIVCRHELPDQVWGLTRGNRIWLCRKLNQVRRRCTLTHELVHLERGPVPTDPVARAKEERLVDAIAAQRLIPLQSLVDAYRWSPGGDHYELAEELWVDVPTLRARMSSLLPHEVATLEHELNGEWAWTP